MPNVIPRVLLDVISRLESDALRFTWTFSWNQDGFSLSAKQVKVPAKRDPRDTANTSGVAVAEQEEVSITTCTRSYQTQALQEEGSGF